MHHLGGVAGGAELAVAEAEVQRRARHQDQIGLAEGGRPGPGDQQRMTGRDDAAALPVGDHRQLQLLRGGPGGRFRAVHPDVRPEHQHRPLRRGQQPGDLADGGRVRAGPRWGRGGRQPGLGLVVQRLQGYVEEDGPAVRGGRQPERLVHRPGQLRGGVLGPGALGHRGQNRWLVDLLQAARTPPVVRGAAAEHDDRGAVEARRRDRADAVGHAGPGGHDGEAGGPGQPGRGLRREHGGLLMPDVDQPDRRPGRPRVHRRVVQREHVTAGQREHGRDAVPPCRRERQRPAVPGQAR